MYLSAIELIRVAVKTTTQKRTKTFFTDLVKSYMG